MTTATVATFCPQAVPTQRGEMAVAVAALNKIIRIAKPISVRVV